MLYLPKMKKLEGVHDETSDSTLSAVNTSEDVPNETWFFTWSAVTEDIRIPFLYIFTPFFSLHVAAIWYHTPAIEQ